MELLDQLEQRINALLARVDTLVVENASLKEVQAKELTTLADENHSLRQELEQERERNNSALLRLEAMLARIKEQIDQE